MGVPGVIHCMVVLALNAETSAVQAQLSPNQPAINTATIHLSHQYPLQNPSSPAHAHLRNHLGCVEPGLAGVQWVGTLDLEPGLDGVGRVCASDEGPLIGGGHALGKSNRRSAQCTRSPGAHVRTRDDMVAHTPAAKPCHRGCGWCVACLLIMQCESTRS